MTRAYTQTKRAEQQAETRRRIVESAVHLHTTLGPALTTLSMIAEHAGVQRHTLYAHFPDERSLFLACSGMTVERDPLPEAEPWRAIEPGPVRLTEGLNAVYGWYERNAALAGCVLRDAAYHPLTQEMVVLRFEPHIRGWHAVLGERLTEAQHGMLLLALSFHTWKTLAREAGLATSDAVAAMVRAVYPDAAG